MLVRYWIYSANNWGIYVNLKVSVRPSGAELQNVFFSLLAGVQSAEAQFARGQFARAQSAGAQFARAPKSAGPICRQIGEGPNWP